MTISNKITISRLILSGLFILIYTLYNTELNFITNNLFIYLSIIIFNIGALSDFLDGFLAKKLNQRTTMGKILDPVADKVFLICFLVILSQEGLPFTIKIPLWYTTIILLRELLVLILFLICYFFRLNFIQNHFHPNFFSKTSTFLQIICIEIVVFNFQYISLEFSYWIFLLFTTLFFAVYSGVLYFLKGIYYFRKN